MKKIQTFLSKIYKKQQTPIKKKSITDWINIEMSIQSI